jgi:uncharacterized membrane protein (Fun14 family)
MAMLPKVLVFIIGSAFLAFFGLVLIGAISKHEDDALTNAEGLRYRTQAIRNECFGLAPVSWRGEVLGSGYLI